MRRGFLGSHRGFFPRIIQLEVSTACQLHCLFCPRTVLADRWITSHLSEQNFTAIVPYLRQVELVHLQGWGEPLLHPRLWDMAAAVKQAGSRVSLTTNGMLLDEDTTREAIRLGVDLIAVSLAGARATTHESLRAGSSLERICANVSYLCQQQPRPRVVLIMQLMKPNLGELPELVSLASKLGVDEVSLPHLDYIPSPEVDALKAFLQPGQEPDPNLQQLLVETDEQASRLGVQLRIFPFAPRDDVMVCEADPLANVWITAEGQVAPCGYLGLPCRSSFPRWSPGGEEYLSPVLFGHVSSGLPRVLAGRTARLFREAFGRRVQWGHLDPIIDLALAPRGHSSPPPPPTPCRTCPKLHGI